MGSCQSDSVIENPIKCNNLSNRILMLKQNEKKLFPDMEEWDGDRYVGIGIKRMKAYKCNLLCDKLTETRNIFWREKTRLDFYWKPIMQACYVGEEQAQLILAEAELIPYDGCMNHLTYGRQHYFVPNYCINDPYFERVLLENNEKEITVILYEGMKDYNYSVKISNHITGLELKKLYLDHLKLDKEKYKVKMFYSGSLIEDDNKLSQFNIDNEYKITLAVLPIDNN